MSEAKKVREILHDAIQSTIAVDSDMPEGAMLFGWVAVAEWVAPDGNRWLSRVDGNAQREGCPAWQTQGYLHNSLFDAGGFIEEGNDE